MLQNSTMANSYLSAEDALDPGETETLDASIKTDVIQPREATSVFGQLSQENNLHNEAADPMHENTGSAADKNDKTAQELKDNAQAEHAGKLLRLRNLLHRRRGLMFAIASALLYAVGNVFMDLLAEDLNVFQVSCTTTSFSIVISAILIGIRQLERPRGKLQWLSILVTGILLALAMPTALLSLRYMSVGASTSVIFTMPIFSGIFGWIFLKESMKPIHVLFVLLSFGGVLLIAQPEFIFRGNVEHLEEENLLLGSTYGLATAVAFALMIVVSRKQTIMGINVFVLMFCNSVVTCFVGAVVCTVVKGWSCPSGANWLQLVGFTSVDFGGQVLMLMALAAEAVVQVSLGITSEVIFAFVLQIIIFQDYPDWITIVGAVLIVISCSGIAMSKINRQANLESRNEEQNRQSDG